MEAVISTHQTLEPQRMRTKHSKRISSRVHRSCPGLRPSSGIVLGGGDATAGPHYSVLFSDHPYAQPELPLLPLPSLPCKPYGIKAISYPPSNGNISAKNPNKKPSSLTSTAASAVPSPLNTKRSSPKLKPHQKKDRKINPKEVHVSAAVSPVNGPDPGELPRGVFMSTSDLHLGNQQAAGSGVEPSCPSIYSLAPPPSSLPLPRFALRPKLACNAMVAATPESHGWILPPSVKATKK